MSVWTPEFLAKVVGEYERGDGPTLIGARYGLTRATVTAKLQREGFARSRASRPGEGRPKAGAAAKPASAKSALKSPPVKRVMNPLGHASRETAARLMSAPCSASSGTSPPGRCAAAGRRCSPAPGSARASWNWPGPMPSTGDRRDILHLAPLAVSAQLVREADKFGIAARQVRVAGDECGPGINITNYQKLDHFDLSRFGGVILDERHPEIHATATPQRG
jgi:hypothetical protein